MIHYLSHHPLTVIAMSVFALAFWKGGAAERGGAGLMSAEWLLELAIDKLQNNGWIAVVPTVFCDFLLAVGLLILALRYGNLWLGVAMVLQGVGLAAHGLALGDDAPGYNLYVTTLNVTTLLMMICLLSGTIVAWRRRGAASRTLANDTLAIPAT